MEKAVKFLGVCILAAAIIVSSMLLYSNKQARYKVAGTRVFDTQKREYVLNSTPLKTPIPKDVGSSADKKYSWQELTSPTPTAKGDITKVIISGKSNVSDNDVTYDISCTVKNNDKIEHKIYIIAIYYDKKNSPITTKNSEVFYIMPGEMQGSSISLYDNIVKNISSYKLEIKENI